MPGVRQAEEDNIGVELAPVEEPRFAFGSVRRSSVRSSVRSGVSVVRSRQCQE